jgi:hypothetical protein
MLVRQLPPAADMPAHGASRAMREYLATLDDAAFGAASEVVPKFVSPSDHRKGVQSLHAPELV